jgi:hypothetical protein
VFVEAARSYQPSCRRQRMAAAYVPRGAASGLGSIPRKKPARYRAGFLH